MGNPILLGPYVPTVCRIIGSHLLNFQKSGKFRPVRGVLRRRRQRERQENDRYVFAFRAGYCH